MNMHIDFKFAIDDLVKINTSNKQGVIRCALVAGAEEGTTILYRYLVKFNNCSEGWFDETSLSLVVKKKEIKTEKAKPEPEKPFK